MHAHLTPGIHSDKPDHIAPAATAACREVSWRLRELADVLETMARGRWHDDSLDAVDGWRDSAKLAHELHDELRLYLPYVAAL